MNKIEAIKQQLATGGTVPFSRYSSGNIIGMESFNGIPYVELSNGKKSWLLAVDIALLELDVAIPYGPKNTTMKVKKTDMPRIFEENVKKMIKVSFRKDVVSSEVGSIEDVIKECKAKGMDTTETALRIKEILDNDGQGELRTVTGRWMGTRNAQGSYFFKAALESEFTKGSDIKTIRPDRIESIVVDGVTISY